MSDVLVLVDHRDGVVATFTSELLAAATRLGDPVALVVGQPGTAEKLAPELGQLGATAIHVAESDDANTYLLTPQVSALAAANAVSEPVAILIASSIDGREIA